MREGLARVGLISWEKPVKEYNSKHRYTGDGLGGPGTMPCLASSKSHLTGLWLDQFGYSAKKSHWRKLKTYLRLTSVICGSDSEFCLSKKSSSMDSDHLAKNYVLMLRWILDKLERRFPLHKMDLYFSLRQMRVSRRKCIWKS